MDDTLTQDQRPARLTAGKLVLDAPRWVALLVFAAIAFLVAMGFGFRSVLS